MQGVTKAKPKQAVKFDKTKRPKPNHKLKENIIKREATRKMKQSNRRKNVYHPAATPRGQTYKTTTRSRHWERNPAAMRRKNLKAQIFKNLIKSKNAELKSAQRHKQKQKKVATRTTKKPQLKKPPSPKQISQHAKEKQKSYKSGQYSNSKTTLKIDKNIAFTKKVIVQTTPTTKPTAISRTTKSIESSKNMKVTKRKALTTNKRPTNIGSTISKKFHATITPATKAAQYQLTRTTIGKTVVDKVLNQQILIASKSKYAKHDKRSLVKKINVAKSKKLMQIHVNKTQIKNVKTVPRKVQKASKKYLEKSNKVKVVKRHKRAVYISTENNNTLDKATMAELGKFNKQYYSHYLRPR